MIPTDTGGERSKPWGGLLNRQSRLSHGTFGESVSSTEFVQRQTFAVVESDFD